MRVNVWFLLALLMVPVGAIADVAQDYYQHLYGDYLHWTEVEAWRASAHPPEDQRSASDGECRLAPNTSVRSADPTFKASEARNTLLVATENAQWLRLRNGDQPIRIRVMRSQDGLLFAENEILALAKHQQYFIALSGSAFIQLTQLPPEIESSGLELTHGCLDNSLSVWLGKPAPLPDILQRREVYLDASAKAVWLHSSNGERQHYQLSPAQELLRITVPELEFPHLELRLPLPLGRAADLDIKWRIKDGEWQTQTFTARLDHRQAWRGSHKQWLLLSERIELALPIDKVQAAELELVSSSAVYLRVTGAAKDDFVFNRKNDPRRVAALALPQTQQRLAEELLAQAADDRAHWNQSAARILNDDELYPSAWTRYFRVLPPQAAGFASQRRWLVPYTQKPSKQGWLAMFSGISEPPYWHSAALKPADRQEIFALPAGGRARFNLPRPTTSRNLRVSVALNSVSQKLRYTSAQQNIPLKVLSTADVKVAWSEAMMQNALVNTRLADEHIAIARYQWRLSADEEQFQIENKGTETAYISVEYEVAKPKPLSEQAFLGFLDSVSTTAVLDWLRTDAIAPSLPAPLARDLRPLRTDLHRARDQWLASTATSRELNAARNRFYQEQAQMAAQVSGPSLSEFIDANRRVNSENSAVAIAALAERNNILIAMAEHSLAQSLLKFDLLNGGDALSKAASEILRQGYSDAGDSDALDMLAIVTFLQRGDARSASVVIHYLFKNGQSGNALRLGLAWQRSQAGEVEARAESEATNASNVNKQLIADVLLRAAVEEGWQDTFNTKLNTLSSDAVAYWQVYALVSEGQFTEARQHVKELAGAAAAQLRELLNDSEPQRARALMALPERSLWTRWRAIDSAQNGRAYLQRVDRIGEDDPYHRYRISGLDSLRYSLRGDRHLRLEVRVVHDNVEARLDRWLRLRINKQWYRLPLLGSVASTTHVLGQPPPPSREYPGQRYFVDIEWHGEGELELLSDDGAILAQLQESNLAIAALRQNALGLPCRDQRQVYIDHTISHVNRGETSPVSAPHALQVNAFCRPQFSEAGNEGVDVTVWPAITESQIAEATQSLVSPFATNYQADVKPAAQQLQIKLLAAIFNVRHGGVISEATFASLQADAYARREHEEVANLLVMLNESSEWRKEETILSMAGSVKLARKWPGVSESAGLRRVVTNTPPERMELRGGDSLAVYIDAPPDSRLRLSLRAVTPSYRRAVPAKLTLGLDEQTLAQLVLGEQDTVREFPLPEGEHRVVMAFVNPLRQHLASIKIEYLRAGEWVSVDQERETRVLAASAAAPLRMYIHDASWLRIDRFSDDRVERKYLFHPGGEINVAAAFKLSDGLFRVHSRRQVNTRTAAEPQLPDYRFYQPTMTVTQDAERVQGDVNVTGLGIGLFDELPRYTSWATLGGYTKHSKRSVLGLQADAEQQRAMELGVRVRKKLDDWEHAYWRSDVFERRVDSGSSSIGSENWLDIYPGGRPWTAHLKMDAYYQQSDVSQLDQAWSLNGDFTLKMPRNFNYKTRLTHEFSVFAHELSLDLADIQRVDTSTMDFDVFNRYRDTHRDGWRYQLGLDYAPYRDGLLQSELTLTGNQHSDDDVGDSVRAGVTWQQLYGNWKIDLDYSLSQYLADSDRQNAYLQQAAGVALERVWWQPRWRWHARAYLRINDGTGGPEAGFELSLDAHHRRGLTDYSLREAVFRDLRVLRYRYQRDGLGVME